MLARPAKSIALWFCWSVLLAAGVCAAASAVQSNQQPRDDDRIVEMEVAVVNMLSGDQLTWAELLDQAGADSVRLKSGSADAKPDVSEEVFGGRIHVLIKGVLQRSGQLDLPGGSFSRRDIADLKRLIARYRADGVKITLSEKAAFGLTPEQLVSVSDALAVPVDFSTKGQPIPDVVKKIADKISLPIAVNSSTQARLASTDTVFEELQGISAGTSLAAIIRPLGLVAVPVREIGQTPQLTLVDSQSAKEFWPVGWPPQTSSLEAAPAMYEQLAVKINNTPLLEALDAIQQRTGVPMLFDHNGLAAKGIELQQINVTLNLDKHSYFAIVRQLLSKNKPRMRLEIRMDEAQKPFVWISAQ